MINDRSAHSVKVIRKSHFHSWEPRVFEQTCWWGYITFNSSICSPTLYEKLMLKREKEVTTETSVNSLAINLRTLTFHFSLWNCKDKMDIRRNITDWGDERWVFIMGMEYSMKPKTAGFQLREDGSVCLILPGLQSMLWTFMWKQAPTSGLIRENRGLIWGSVQMLHLPSYVLRLF